MDSDSFDKISNAINANDTYENVVHDVCRMPNVTSLKEFLKMYEVEENAIDGMYDELQNAAPTVELFTDVFKKLDEYPANLQKFKKPHQMRERLNSNVSKSSPTLNDSSSYISSKESSTSLLNLNKFDGPTASETLSNFIKFQKQLKQLKAEMKQDVEEEYVNKLKQLTIFSQQLEKLLPTEKVGKSALNPQEEKILEDLVNRMDDLNFIRSHHSVLHQKSTLINNVPTKLDSLVDILSYCLLAVNAFKTN